MQRRFYALRKCPLYNHDNVAVFFQESDNGITGLVYCVYQIEMTFMCHTEKMTTNVRPKHVNEELACIGIKLSRA